MKRTSLTTAVIAGIAGVAGISSMANAVYLNQDGLGQVLIYPYYTVNGGNSTLLTVVNTTNVGKAVKVRFLEAYDSREVLDFNLYLSPQDVWVANVVPSGNGAGVITNDNSCTVPTIPVNGSPIAFRTAAFDGSIPSEPNDGGPSNISRTLEGYVEVIEMGTLTPTNNTNNSLAAITHKNGVPANCAQIYGAWNGGYWSPPAGNADTDISAASGGLFGSGAIINVAQGTIAGYNADAIDQFFTTSINHTAPGDLLPSLTSGDSDTSYVFAPVAAGSTLPALATSTYGASVDAVTSLFMADALYNEYWTDAGLGANSEWVVTFPTKRFYVDPATAIGPGTAAFQPFDTLFSSVGGGTSCSAISLNFFDREELTPSTSSGLDFSPSPVPEVPATSLCWESQVVSFNQSNVGHGNSASAILGSNLANNINTGMQNGWAVINLYNGNKNHILSIAPGPAGTAATGNTFRGLPVTGFWVTNLVNGQVSAGVLSNYSALFRHKVHRACSLGDNTTTACN